MTNDSAGSSLPPNYSAETAAVHQQLLRTTADFMNYRNRMEREIENIKQRAEEQLVAQLLGVIDDLERALEHAEHHEQLVSGVTMTARSLATVLAQRGLKRIDCSGPFDPHIHEAVLAQLQDGYAEGDIISVMRAGYMIHDRVLRHAQVIVAQ